MKCYFHNDKDSVSSCAECWAFLCRECSDKFTYNWKIICERCAEKVNNLAYIEKWKIKTKVILCLSLWIFPFLWPLLANLWQDFSSIVWPFIAIYWFFIIAYLWGEIPKPGFIWFGWWLFWLIVIYFYLVWCVIYIMLIYPIKNFKYLFKNS